MGDILVLKEIVEDVKQRPRDVTLVGEWDLICSETNEYDLVFCLVEGITHDRTFDPKYVSIPMYLDPGSEESLAGKLQEYYKHYKNAIGGVCGTGGIFGLYDIEQAEDGLHIFPMYFVSVVTAEALFARLSGQGWSGFPEELQEKIEEITNK